MFEDLWFRYTVPLISSGRRLFGFNMPGMHRAKILSFTSSSASEAPETVEEKIGESLVEEMKYKKTQAPFSVCVCVFVCVCMYVCASMTTVNLETKTE